MNRDEKILAIRALENRDEAPARAVVVELMNMAAHVAGPGIAARAAAKAWRYGSMIAAGISVEQVERGSRQYWRVLWDGRLEVASFSAPWEAEAAAACYARNINVAKRRATG